MPLRVKLLLPKRPGVNADWLITVGHKRREDRLRVGAIASLHRDVEARALGRDVKQKAPMLDLKDIGAEPAEPGVNLPEHPGLIGDGEAKADDAVFPFERAHHDDGKNPRVDVAPA